MLAATPVFAAAAALAAAPAPATPGGPRALDVDAVAWSLPDAHVVLGETASVVVRLSARTASGAPLDVAPPQLSASTGALGPPVRTGPGTWTATFTAPKEMFPHVAILVASIETAHSTAVGFAALPLWGKGATTVKTKPKSKVTVLIGDDSFGPVDAGADGSARVPIVVPPGPERAVARSVDDVGNASHKVIDLGVPGFNRVALVALDDSVPAGGEARLLAFAVDRRGQPLADAAFSTHAGVGVVDKNPVPLAPGMFELVYRPGNAPRGRVFVDVALAGEKGSSARAAVEVLAGTPARADVELPRSALSADEPRAVDVAVRLFDAANNAVPARAASLDVDFGRIDAVRDVDGVRRVRWVIPAALPPARTTAVLTVRSKRGRVLGTKSLALLPGKPARLAFAPVPDVIADGTSAVDVRVTVSDAAGNALVPTGAALTVDPAQGQLVAATVDGSAYRARFIPAARDHADFATLHASLGGLRADAAVKLAPRPRARLLVGIGAIAGSNYGALVHAGPDVSLLVRLPGLDGSVHAGLGVAVLQSLARAKGVLDERTFPVCLEAAWRPLLTSDVTLHLGAAAGIVLVDETVDAARAPLRVVSPGAVAQAVAGAGYRLGPGFLELDVRAGYAAAFPEETGASPDAPLGAGVELGYRFGI